MSVETVAAVNALGELLQGLGVIGMSLFIIALFLQGKIVTERTVDKFNETMALRAKILAEELAGKMEEAVRRGFVEAWYEINGGRRKEDQSAFPERKTT